jgi:hypothetical protein
MAHVTSSPSGGTTVAQPAGTSFIEWGPIIAGAVLASALSFVLLTFGTAIGLSATSPWPGSGLSATMLAILAILWTMIQQIGTFMAGGYVAGRMRSPLSGLSQDETQFRDGLHGGLVWAVGIAIGAALLLATAGGVARTGADIAGKTAAAFAASNPMDPVLDTMLRPGTPQAGGAQQAGAQGAVSATEQRAELTRVLTGSLAKGALTPQDRTYLAQVIAQRTGIPQPEAEKRVNEAFNAAREAADKARRAAVLTGFVTAAGLITSFGAAWWAAMQGGQHRDNSVPARFGFADRVRPTARLGT